MDYAFINGTNATLDCKLWSKFYSLVNVFQNDSFYILQVAFVRKIGFSMTNIVFKSQLNFLTSQTPQQW